MCSKGVRQPGANHGVGEHPAREHTLCTEQHETINLNPGDTQVNIVCTGELVRTDSMLSEGSQP